MPKSFPHFSEIRLLHMKILKTILSAILVAACMGNVTAEAKTTKSSKNAHSAAHKELMANAKSHLDKGVVSDMMKSEIMAREADHSALSAESAAIIDDLLKEANTHLGKRYVHGSKGPNTFDCSGFSSYVYKQFGYKISPASRAQYLEGTPVKDRKDLRKGDLVFFTSRSSGKNVGHVGIVTEANPETGHFKFIHASLRGVKISECEGYYANRYVGAKRIINK